MALLTALTGFHEAVAPVTGAFAEGSVEAQHTTQATQALATLRECAAAGKAQAKDAQRRAGRQTAKLSPARLRDTLENVTGPLAASAHTLAHQAAEAVKLATRAEIEAADWSLTPGRYVGVAPAEEDDDFDFDATMRGIHTAVAELDREAAKLARTIYRNFEELLT